jgi:hypothetical protein
VNVLGMTTSRIALVFICFLEHSILNGRGQNIRVLLNGVRRQSPRGSFPLVLLFVILSFTDLSRSFDYIAPGALSLILSTGTG